LHRVFSSHFFFFFFLSLFFLFLSVSRRYLLKRDETSEPKEQQIDGKDKQGQKAQKRDGVERPKQIGSGGEVMLRTVSSKEESATQTLLNRHEAAHCSVVANNVETVWKPKVVGHGPSPIKIKPKEKHKKKSKRKTNSFQLDNLFHFVFTRHNLRCSFAMRRKCAFENVCEHIQC
jgi:hypothetical protein